MWCTAGPQLARRSRYTARGTGRVQYLPRGPYQRLYWELVLISAWCTKYISILRAGATLVHLSVIGYLRLLSDKADGRSHAHLLQPHVHASASKKQVEMGVSKQLLWTATVVRVSPASALRRMRPIGQRLLPSSRCLHHHLSPPWPGTHGVGAAACAGTSSLQWHATWPHQQPVCGPIRIIPQHPRQLAAASQSTVTNV